MITSKDNALGAVKVLPSPLNGGGLVCKQRVKRPFAPAAPNSPRVEYNAIKLDNSSEKAQALYLTSSVPENVIPALEGHFQTNWVVDFGDYQLERVEEKAWDDCRKATLCYRGIHMATMRWAKEDARDSLRFGISRCLEEDGTRIARMVEAVTYVSRELQTFASCPVNYEKPLPNPVCGVSYGDKTLVQVDTLHLKITEGATDEIYFYESDVFKLGAYQLVDSGTGGRMFENKAQIWFQGQQIGNLLWGARMKTHEGFAKVEISNRVLYDSQVFTHETVDNFLTVIGSTVDKIYRVDVAYDSAGLMSFLQSVHRRDIVAVRQMSYKKGKKYVNLATDEIEGFYFGSRSAGRFARCYDKTLELETSRKDYISKFHEINGLKGRICRVELELKSDYLRTVSGLNWWDVFDRAKMSNLGKEAMSGWFDWVPANDGDSKLNRRERVRIIDFAEVKDSGYERFYPEPVKTNRMEKIMIKQCILRAEAAPCDASAVEYLQTAAALTEYNSLGGWLLSKDEQFAKIIQDRAQLEGREVAGRFYGRSWHEVMTDAYENHQPVNTRNGEVVSITPITHYEAA
jgi:hypothetical protein